MDVPVARRVERPLWFNARTVLGLLLFAGAFLAGQRLLADARSTVEVWAAADDLPRNHALGAGDLEVREVRMPADLLARYVTSSQELDRFVLTQPIRRGELIARDWLAAPGTSSGELSMSVPVTPEHAVGGSLRPGDRVNVFATFDPGGVRARTTAVVRDAEIIDVVSAGGLVVGEDAVIGITIGVSSDGAADLAYAIRNAEIDIARVDAPTTRGVAP